VADWVTISSLATAGGTLVLAVATFGAVRSANNAARVAERSLLATQRPLLMPSRLQDAPQKVGFIDGKWFQVPGGCGIAEAGDDAVYLVMSVRNVGTGMAVLHGWQFTAERRLGASPMPPLDAFHRLTRDLYVPAGDIGFWQGAMRDAGDDAFDAAQDAVRTRRPFTIDVLYGDHEGGQRVISRFTMNPRKEGGEWVASVARHWNIDRPDPR
jgi:hypothetical protein